MNANDKKTLARAGCGKSARPVRREGGRLDGHWRKPLNPSVPSLLYNYAEPVKQAFANPSEGREGKELENEIRDLQITNRAKDMVIEQMQKARNGFFDQLLTANRKMGELEAKLLQLEGPKP